MSYQAPTKDEAIAIVRSAGMSVPAVARRIGVSNPIVYHWMTGYRGMPYPALYTLAHRVYGVAVDPDTWRDQINDKLSEVQS